MQYHYPLYLELYGTQIGKLTVDGYSTIPPLNPKLVSTQPITIRTLV